jgi:small multidrug resistance family-3 protein
VVDRRGIVALGVYGFTAAFQPDPDFGRILAAYGGIFVVGSLAWATVAVRFRPDRWDVIGAVICLLGVAVIMYAPARTPDLRRGVLPGQGERGVRGRHG